MLEIPAYQHVHPPYCRQGDVHGVCPRTGTDDSAFQVGIGKFLHCRRFRNHDPVSDGDWEDPFPHRIGGALQLSERQRREDEVVVMSSSLLGPLASHRTEQRSLSCVLDHAAPVCGELGQCGQFSTGRDIRQLAALQRRACLERDRLQEYPGRHTRCPIGKWLALRGFAPSDDMAPLGTISTGPPFRRERLRQNCIPDLQGDRRLILESG